MPLATLTNSVLGYRHLPLHLSLAAFGTAAQDYIAALPFGYAGQILGIDFITTLAGTGSGATQTFSVKIGTTVVTGLAATITLAGTAATGVVQSFAAMTGAVNTSAGGYFRATDTLTISCAASGTVFTAGSGILLLRLAKFDGQ
jgi:hypothetical protein